MEKAFYFLIEKQNWEFACIVLDKLPNVNKTHANIVMLMNGLVPIDCEEWLLEIDQYSLFEYSKLESIYNLDRYTHLMLWFLVEKKYNEFFLPHLS